MVKRVLLVAVGLVLLLGISVFAQVSTPWMNIPPGSMPRYTGAWGSRGGAYATSVIVNPSKSTTSLAETFGNVGGNIMQYSDEIGQGFTFGTLAAATICPPALTLTLGGDAAAAATFGVGLTLSLTAKVMKTPRETTILHPKFGGGGCVNCTIR